MSQYCFQQIRLTLTWRTITADSLAVSEICVFRTSVLTLDLLLHWLFLLSSSHISICLARYSHTVTQEQHSVNWVRPEIHVWTVSRSHLHLWEMREPNLHSLQNAGADTEEQEIHRGPAKLLIVSFTALCGLTFDSLFCSEHLAYIFMELITHSSFLFLIFCHSSSPTGNSATQQLALPHPQGDGEENQKKKIN